MEEPKSVLNSTTELSYVVIYAQLCFVCQWIVEKLSPSVGFAVMNFTWHLFGRRQQLAVNRAKHRKRFTEATFAMTLTFDQKSLLLEQDSIPLAPLMVVRYPFDQIESIFFFLFTCRIGIQQKARRILGARVEGRTICVSLPTENKCGKSSSTRIAHKLCREKIVVSL